MIAVYVVARLRKAVAQVPRGAAESLKADVEQVTEGARR